MIKVQNLSFSYGKKNILNNINFTLKDNSIHCILGPSGCGKSTLLNCIAGFIKPQKGIIIKDETIISSNNSFLPPEKRNLSLVLQSSCLFPHINVSDNICFGKNKLNKKEKKELTKKLLQQVGLNKTGDEFPHELSGGEAQRVAIARALARNVKTLLFDEPFSNLDNTIKKKLRDDIKKLIKEHKLSALFITHSVYEAFDLADEISIMNNGIVLQTGSSIDLSTKPNSIFIADFIGSGNIINTQDTNSLSKIVSSKLNLNQNEAKYIYFPYGSFQLEKENGELELEIKNTFYRGDHFHYLIDYKGKELNITSAEDYTHYNKIFGTIRYDLLHVIS